jgi:hypothetical protein
MLILFSHDGTTAQGVLWLEMVRVKPEQVAVSL